MYLHVHEHKCIQKCTQTHTANKYMYMYTHTSIQVHTYGLCATTTHLVVMKDWWNVYRKQSFLSW